MTTEILRPDATISQGAWTLVGAASAHGATSDNSDSSYAVGPVGAQMTLGLGSFALPAGAVTKSVRSRWRGRGEAAASQLTLTVIEPATTLYREGTAYFRDATDAASVTAPLTSTVADGAAAPTAWAGDQTAIGALTLRVAVSGSEPVRVHELYVDVEYAAQPTLDAIGPSGAQTASTSVLLQWQHFAGSGGGPQAFHQHRIFSTSQLGVSGFNPATSAATFDTGFQVGTASSMLVGPLPNDTSYRAYTRTAQSVNGSPHWSEWDYTDFSVATPAPTVLSVVAAGVTPLVRLTVSRDTTGEPWDLVEVERSDDDSVTWTPVRGATLVDPPGDVWIGYDNEAGNGVTVRYRARGVAVVGGSQMAGAWKVSNTTSWSADAVYLKDLTFTANSRTVKVRQLPEPTFPIDQGVHSVIGAGYKTVISGVRTGEEAEITFRTDNATEAADLKALLDQPVLLLQFPAGWDTPSRYIVPGAVRRLRLSNKVYGRAARMRWFQVPYIETARPVDNGLVVPATTWEDVADQALTWEQMLAAGTTWGDLL